MKVVYQGWQGHFLCDCMFHLNTAVIEGDIIYIVSTVGNYYYNGERQEIGYNRYFETMVFKGYKEGGFYETDVSDGEVYFEGYINEEDAQNNHSIIVDKVKKWMIEGGDLDD